MKKLLVIADQDNKRHAALQRGIALATQTGATIHWVGFAYMREEGMEFLTAAQRSTVKASLLASKRKDMENTLSKSPKAKVDIEIVWEKDVAGWILKHVAGNNYDMVLKTGHRSESLIYTPTDWQLLRECPVPVMIVASKTWKKRARIVAAVDLSTKVDSKRALNYKVLAMARSLADASDGELHLAYTIEVPQVLSDLDLIDGRKLAAKRRKALQPIIAGLREQYGIASEHVHLRQGSAGKAIPSIATKLKADLVVIGTVGRKGLHGRLMGNTAEQVLTRLHTDIVALKPD
ncbi:MAG TPA: universal stress protein [Spongiibacteraceae bacterium]|nr:universal stress protein [Spongiibacteraceae bacterium]